MMLVTISIPIYKRLEYLPHVLNIVRSQDYPNIELIVSDNGQNGSKVEEIVARHYTRPYKIRQNARSVSISTHFNQLVHAAAGKYFLLLADDDEISSNYVSETAGMLERFPQASMAVAKQEILNENGAVIRESSASLPEIVTGPDFIRGTWGERNFKFECFATFLARTAEIKACGGFPEFKTGSHNDNALVIKLCLNNYVAYSPKCSFRWRVYENSHGWSIGIRDLAQDTRQFMAFLNQDPAISRFSSRYPGEWKELKRVLCQMAWKTYLGRWRSMYRHRMGFLEWIYAAFAMPPILHYYLQIGSTFWRGCTRPGRALIRGLLDKQAGPRS
jgi:glycosyltransferase involved in cell wall biosynthesis